MNMIKSLSLISLLGTCLAAWSEPIPLTTLSVELEKGVVRGQGRTVTFDRVPVTDSDTGLTRYYSFSSALKVDSNNNLLLSNITEVVDVTAKIAQSASIRSGIYSDSDGRFFAVTGPTISENGYFAYSMDYIDVLNEGESIVVVWTSAPSELSLYPDSDFKQHDGKGHFGYVEDDVSSGFWDNQKHVLISQQSSESFLVTELYYTGTLSGSSKLTYEYPTYDEFRDDQP